VKAGAGGDCALAVVDLSAQRTQEQEEEQEQRHRQLLELLNELRVAMPGVQVLFGFLLTVPFQQRFAETSQAQKTLYVVTLCAAAVATAFLIGPSALHRVAFRRGQKRFVIGFGTWEFLGGIAALAVAMCGAVLLVVSFLFEGPTPIVIVAALAVLYLTLWFGVGIWRRKKGNGD
jgi:Family of unknown function (DUF6328)